MAIRSNIVRRWKSDGSINHMPTKQAVANLIINAVEEKFRKGGEKIIIDHLDSGVIIETELAEFYISEINFK